MNEFKSSLGLQELEPRTLCAVFTWIGTSDPNNVGALSGFAWSNPANWAVGGEATAKAPQSGDEVVLDGNATKDTTDDIAGLELSKLTITSGFNGKRMFLDNTLTVDSGSMATSTPTVNDFTIATRSGNLVFKSRRIRIPVATNISGPKKPSKAMALCRSRMPTSGSCPALLLRNPHSI